MTRYALYTHDVRSTSFDTVYCLIAVECWTPALRMMIPLYSSPHCMAVDGAILPSTMNHQGPTCKVQSLACTWLGSVWTVLYPLADVGMTQPKAVYEF